MFGYMTEIDTVEMIDTQEIEADGKCSVLNMHSLFYNVLMF